MCLVKERIGIRMVVDEVWVRKGWIRFTGGGGKSRHWAAYRYR